MVRLIKCTHIGVYGLIVRGGRALLIRKGRGPYAGRFDIPGGKAEFGETLEETLQREVFEETGLRCTCMQLVDAVTNTIKWTRPDGEIEDLHHIGVIYVVRVEDEHIKVECDGQDSMGAEWVDILTVHASKFTNTICSESAAVREVAM